MNTCKTCKWWANIPDEMRGCLFVETFEYQSKPDLFAVEEACDGYGDRRVPCVVTGPEFGCIHHEEKQAC